MEKIKSPLVIPIFASTIALAFSVTVSFLFGWNPLLPAAVFGSLILFFVFLTHPLAVLSALIVLRMSLDYSSSYLTLSWQDISLTLSQFVGLGIALLGIVLLVLYRKEIIRFPLIWPFLLMLGWGTFTLFYSLSPSATFEELLRVFGLFVIGFFAFVSVTDIKKYTWLLISIFLSGLIPLALGLYQYLFGIGFADADVSVPRIFATFSHPNIFSLYLFALIGTVALYFSLEKNNVLLSKNIVSFFGFATLILLLLTFTRVAWVTTFVFICTLVYFRHRLALLPLLLFPLLLILLSPTVQDRVKESFQAHPDSSVVWRQNLWHDVSLKTIQDDRALLGAGMNTFPIVSESLRGERFGSNDAHNDFVKFFAEGGVVGVSVLILYLLSFLFILWNAYRKTNTVWLKNSLVIFILFFGSLTLASLSDNLFKNTPVEWIFFALFGALLSLVYRKE